MASTIFTNHQDQRIRTRFELYSPLALEQAFYTKYMDVQKTGVYSEGYTGDEGFSDVAPLNESGNIQRLNGKEGHTTFLTSSEFAGQFDTTYKEYLQKKDNTILMNKMIDSKVDKAMASMRRFIERKCSIFFNDGFAGASVLAPDGAAIFGTHTYKTGATFTNRLPSNPVAGAAGLAALEKFGGAFKGPQADEMPIMYDSLVAKSGSTAATALKKVLRVDGYVPTTEDGVNIYNNGRYTLYEVPYITSDTAWFAFDSTLDNPFLIDFVQTPTLGEPIKQNNEDEIRNVLTSFKMGCTALPFAWAGSDGTGA